MKESMKKEFVFTKLCNKQISIPKMSIIIIILLITIKLEAIFFGKKSDPSLHPLTPFDTIIICAYYVGFQAFMGDNWDIEEAKTWTIKNSQCSNKYSVTRCGSTQILGGYDCLAKDASIQKSFTLPHHWKIQISVTFWMIDSWDSEDLVMSLGSITIQERRQHASSDQPICGANGNWLGLNKEAYYDRKYNKNLENGPHFERSISAYFSSNLNGAADDESFGINNFQLLIDPCNPTCDKCINGPESFNCLNCWNNASFLKFTDSQWVCECPKGSYSDYSVIAKGGTCPTGCSPNFKQSGFCKCNDGYYTQSKDVPCNDAVCTECIKCDSTCKLCSGPGPSSCVACASNLYKQFYTQPDVPTNHPKYGQTLCQADCLNESYYKDKTLFTCLKCNSLCKTCNGSLSAECTSCPSGQYLDGTDIGGGIIVGFCVTSCSQGYYKDSTTMRCLRCNSAANCIDCKDNSPNYCLSCKNKYHLKDGTCYLSCPDGYWNDTPNRMCKICNTKCSTCLGSATFCTSCTGNYYLMNNDCLNDQCPNGYYKNKDTTPGKNTCQKCDKTCLTCNGGTFSDCLSCDPAIGFLKGKLCTFCNSNQYGNTNDQTCHPCNPNCESCEGPSEKQCRSCSDPLYYYDKQCLNECPDKTYPDKNNHICQSCDEECNTCFSAGPSSCKSCKEGRYLKNFVCETSCSIIGEYPDSLNRVCGVCNTLCSKCKDGTSKGCLECAGAKYLQESECVDTCKSNLFGMVSTKICHEKCPDGYYGDIPSKTCLNCHPLCPICSTNGLNNCSVCMDPLFLDGTKCIEICPPGYYGDTTDRKCKKCNQNCLECFGGTDKECTKCHTGKFIGDNQCYTKCPNQKYGDMITMSCVVECPLGTYGNQSENVCKVCHGNCTQCYGPSYSQCQKCSIGFYNLNGTCDSCPRGYYSEDLDRTCQLCFENCTACTGGSPNECTACTRGSFYYKEKKMCLSTCPAPYYSEDNNPNCILSCSQPDQYPNTITRKCDICNVACKKCTNFSEYSCQECAPNYFFVPSMQYCTKKCPQGYFENIINYLCEPCHKTCSQCNGAQSDQCTSCDEPNILYQNRCQTDCPDNYFRDEESRMCVTSCTISKPNRFPNLTTKKCQNCHHSCSRCTGPTNKECSKCANSFVKQGNSCLESCPIGYYGMKNNSNSNQNPDLDDCFKCHQNCEDCYGGSEKECRTCARGLFLYENTQFKDNSYLERSCLVKCPSGFIPNYKEMTCDQCPLYTYQLNETCQQCHYSCLKCSGPLKSDCLECSNDRSVAGSGKPQYGQCNCKSGYMESYSNECVEATAVVQAATKSVTVSAITTGTVSLLSTLISSSAFSLYQIIEVSQFTSHIRYANVTFPLNINFIFDSISTSQPNEAIKKDKQPTLSNQKRILMDKSELEYLKEVDQSPQLWQRFIFTLLINVASWVSVLIINIFVTRLKIKYDKKRILEKIRIMTQYTLPIQVFIRTAQEGFQFIYLSFYFNSSLDLFGWLNCIYMTLTAIGVCMVIIKGSFLPIIKKKKVNEDDQNDEYIQQIQINNKINIQYPHPLRTLWVFFRDTKLCRNYYSILLGLKMIYLIVFVFTSSVLTQMISMAATKLIFFFYVLILKPYKHRWYNYINIFNEFIQVLIPITVLVLSTSTEDNYEAIGWLLMIQIIILFLINFVYAVIEMVMMLKNIIAQKMNKSKKEVQVCDDKVMIKGQKEQEQQFGVYKNRRYKIMNAAAIEVNDVEGSKQLKSVQQLQGMQKESTPVKVFQTYNIMTTNQITSNINGLQSNQVVKFDVEEEDDENQQYQNLENSSQKDIENSNFKYNKSYVDEDLSNREQSLNTSGFPLTVFGKNFEETEISNAARKKKKTKRKQESNPVSLQNEEQNKKDQQQNLNEKQFSSLNESNNHESDKIKNEQELKQDQDSRRNQKNLQSCDPKEQQQLDIVEVMEEQNRDFASYMEHQKTNNSQYNQQFQNNFIISSSQFHPKQDSSAKKIQVNKDSYAIDLEGDDQDNIILTQNDKKCITDIIDERKKKKVFEKQNKSAQKQQKQDQIMIKDENKQIDQRRPQTINSQSLKQSNQDGSNMKELQKTFYIPRILQNEGVQFNNIEQKIIVQNKRSDSVNESRVGRKDHQPEDQNQPKSFLEFIKSNKSKFNIKQN